MLILVFIAFLAGIIRYRYWDYWKWALIMLAWVVVGPLLFAGDGTLENPNGDGILAHQVRVLTNDGPGMAVFGLAFLAVFYGGIIYFTRRMFLAVKQRREPLQARLDNLPSHPGGNAEFSPKTANLRGDEKSFKGGQQETERSDARTPSSRRAIKADGAMRDQIIKWGSPIAIGLALIGWRYAQQWLQDDHPGLKGTVRSEFVNAAVPTCLEETKRARSDLSQSVLSQDCNCYANGMADKLSNHDLKAAATTPNETLVAFQPMMDLAVKACIDVISDASSRLRH
jgi:hypothetical protein